jgi:hypothetical protein
MNKPSILTREEEKEKYAYVEGIDGVKNSSI